MFQKISSNFHFKPNSSNHLKLWKKWKYDYKFQAIISAAFNNKKKSQSINCASNLEIELEVDYASTTKDTNKNIHLSDVKQCNENKKKGKCNYEKMDCKLIIPSNEWKKIYLVEKKEFISFTYPFVISKYLTKITGCQINIKGHDILKSKITVRVYCSHCDSNGNKCRRYKILNSNFNEGVFDIYYENIPICHTNIKMRQVSAYERQLYAEKTIANRIDRVSEQLIEDENSDFVQKHLTLMNYKTDDVLRKIRSEQIKKHDMDSDDIKDLINEYINQEDPYFKYLQKVSLIPFNVQCWSPMQKDFVRYMRQKMDGNMTLYLDATGGLVRKPKISCKSLYYYALVLPILIYENEPTIPVAITDMVSGSHTYDTIHGWLFSFRIYLEKEFKFWPIFQNIVIDFSFAEINSTVEAFNRIDIVQYINEAYHSLHTQDSNFKSKYVKIILCSNHLMNNMSRDVCKHFPKYYRGTQILKSILAYFIVENNYVQLKEIFKNLVILLKSKYISKQTVESMENILKISNENINFSDDVEKDCDAISVETRDLENTIYNQSLFYKEFNEISKTITIDPTFSGGVNYMYNPQFLEIFLKKYIAYLPMVSKIVLDCNKYSNSHVENYFKIIKKRFKEDPIVGKLPTKCGRFIRSIHKRNCVIHKRIKTLIPKKTLKENKKQKISEISVLQSKSVLEVWKKNNIQETPKRKSIYFSKTLLKNIDGNNIQKQNKIINILCSNPKNKNKYESRKVNEELSENLLPFLLQNGNNIEGYYENTCAFDAFIQGVSMCKNIFISDMNYQKIINKIKTHDTLNIYKIREDILREIFGITNDCTSNVTKVSSHFLKTYPSVFIKFECPNCDNKIEVSDSYVSINISFLETKFGIQNLKECIEHPPKCCIKCVSENEENSSYMNIKTIKYNDAIFFYTETISRKNISLKSIPKEIKLNNEFYFLRGVIVYYTNHYVAFLLQKENWIKYDGLRESSIKIRNEYTENIEPHLIIYEKEDLNKELI